MVSPDAYFAPVNAPGDPQEFGFQTPHTQIYSFIGTEILDTVNKPTFGEIEDAETADPAVTAAPSSFSSVDPLYGTVTKWNIHHPCTGSSIEANITPGETVEFVLSGVASGIQVFHFVGTARLLKHIGCIMIRVGKNSSTTTDANGIAKRFHPWKANSYINSQ